ncbi:MAG: hypothetical protein KAS16_08600 [Thermoplasmata archaeon]|nr:hypothetical protein [Thermoplasmata archaeon]
MSDIFSIARVIIGISILAMASLSDLRTRRVDNKLWVIMGSLGVLILGIEILTSGMGEPWNTSTTVWNYNHLLALVPTIILFYDIFWDREALYDEGKINFIAWTVLSIAILAAAGLLWIEGVSIQTMQLLMVPIMIIIGYVFFYTGIIHGGADAKAFMSIAILMPFSPLVGDILPIIQYPSYMAEAMSMMFPFAFLTLMNAAMISVVGFLCLVFLLNLIRKDLQFPAMFFGYRMDIDEIPKKYVWPMEVVRDDEVVLYIFGKRDANIKEELEMLKQRGIQDVWVTPKLPFIIPMFLGFVFSFFVGNVITLFFNAYLI